MPSKQPAQRVTVKESSSAKTAPDAPPLEIRAHHLVCAVCARGGAKSTPAGKRVISRLMKAMADYPYTQLKITADMEAVRAHYFDLYEKRGGRLPANQSTRSADYTGRKKDLEVCRLLGIAPNTTLPAFWVYSILFSRKQTLEGICRTGNKSPRAWKECPNARKSFYEKIAARPRLSLKDQTRLGEKLGTTGGVWAMLGPRTRAAMKKAKQASSKHISSNADRLYIRPNHALCILCTAATQKPLIEDNLIELRKRMEADPDIPVCLTEGCCMVCDPCNIYHPGEHICYGNHIKNPLRDLMMLEKLDLQPGVVLPAAKLYRLIYEKIRNMEEVCGWGDGSNTAPFWASCGGYRTDALEKARNRGLITGEPVKYRG